MKFGVSVSMSAGDRTGGWGKRLERIAAWGVDGIELHVQDPLDLPSFREIRQRLTALGLQATVAGWQSASVPLERHVRELVDTCALLDATMLCGSFPFSSDRVGVTMLAGVAEYAASRGVTLALGGHTGRSEKPARSVAETSRLVDAAGMPNLGVLYNTFQAHVEEPSISSAILSAGARLRHVQVAENDGASPGGGQVRWSETFAALDAIRYDGWYVVEAKRGGDDDDGLALAGLHFLRRHRRSATAA